MKLPAGDSREFAQVALRHGILIMPGPTMSSAEQHAPYIRLPFLAEEETLRAGVRRLSRRMARLPVRRPPRPEAERHDGLMARSVLRPISPRSRQIPPSRRVEDPRHPVLAHQSKL